MTAERGRPLVVFDFDGTLTHRDSLVGFLRRVAGTPTVARAAAATAPLLARAARDDGARDAAKAALLARVFGGLHHRVVRAAGDEYGAALVERGLRADTRARLEWHRTQGHELAIVSASLDAYLVEVARRLDVGLLACTQLDSAGDGHLTGRLLGANCRGPEKVRRLDALVTLDGRDVYAYGDSAGDRELLERADVAVWVGRKARPSPAYHHLTTPPHETFPGAFGNP